MTVPTGDQGAQGTPAPAAGTPAPGDEQSPEEMLGAAFADDPPAGSESGNEPVRDAAYWQADAEKWKGLSRKNEQRAKENAAAAKKLADIEQANMTEVEKANARAKAAEDAAALSDQRYFRTMAIATYDLPVELLEDLGSGTEEEIMGRAERLSNILKSRDGQGVGAGQGQVNGGVGPQFRTGRPVESLRPGGAPAGNQAPQTPDDLFRGLIQQARP